MSHHPHNANLGEYPSLVDPPQAFFLCVTLAFDIPIVFLGVELESTRLEEIGVLMLGSPDGFAKTTDLFCCRTTI
jgi:hypothetical protein